MSNVSQVIFDALAARQSLVLPGIGSLEVKRRKAKRISETQIIPPQNVVTFSPDEIEGASSVVSLIASNDDESDLGAKSIYGSWFEDSRAPDGGFIIDGVGEINDGRFIISEPLHKALNPVKEDIVTMERERNGMGSMWPWIIVGILAALLVFGALWCWKNGVFDRAGRDRGYDYETVMQNTEPVGDEVAADVVSTDEAAAGVVGGSAAGQVTEPRFHVIAGSFAVAGNAEKLMNRIRRNHPELTVEKIVNPGNGYEMVSIFSAPTERQAYNKMNMYWDIDLYLWVYEQK